MILWTQEDSLWLQKPSIQVEGFVDAFYIYDANKNGSADRQAFFYNHNRSNTPHLNLGFLKCAFNHPKYRANFALHTGTYSTDNYKNEHGILKHIFEANIGISLNSKNNLWIDVGVMPSHIGFESAISTDNWTLTRSLLAENSPYYMTGLKLSYQPNKNIEIAALILNGWQRLQGVRGNSTPSFGSKFSYSPTETFRFNWSTFIGTDDPDSLRRWRYFNNFYAQFQLSKKIEFITGFDIGMQQSQTHSANLDLWYSPVFISRLALSTKWKTALRGEYYKDGKGVLIPTAEPNGFNTLGLSMNLDYAPTQNLVCRIEGRWLHSNDNLYETKTTPSNTSFILGTSVVVKFSKIVQK